MLHLLRINNLKNIYGKKKKKKTDKFTKSCLGSHDSKIFLCIANNKSSCNSYTFALQIKKNCKICNILFFNCQKLFIYYNPSYRKNLITCCNANKFFCKTIFCKAL